MVTQADTQSHGETMLTLTKKIFMGLRRSHHGQLESSRAETTTKILSHHVGNENLKAFAFMEVGIAC